MPVIDLAGIRKVGWVEELRLRAASACNRMPGRGATGEKVAT